MTTQSVVYLHEGMNDFAVKTFTGQWANQAASDFIWNNKHRAIWVKSYKDLDPEIDLIKWARRHFSHVLRNM